MVCIIRFFFQAKIFKNKNFYDGRKIVYLVQSLSQISLLAKISHTIKNFVSENFGLKKKSYYATHIWGVFYIF